MSAYEGRNYGYRWGAGNRVVDFEVHIRNQSTDHTIKIDNIDKDGVGS
jgi:hypothetical protein